MFDEMQTEIGPTDSAALYKNATTLSQPIVDHKHLQFIRAYNDERILLGACNLNGRFWNGSTWLYDDCSSFDKSQAFINFTTESAVTDADFIERDKFFVVEDSGVLQILQIADNPNTHSREFQCLGYTCQHDDSILSASIFDSKARVVTGGMDRCIKVWDMGNLLAEHSYEGAHTNIITCVDAKPKSNDVFASSGLDCEAVIWDVRQETPAQVVYSNPGRKFVAVAWRPSDDNVLVVGTIDGCLTLIDVRKPQDFITNSCRFRRSIHKMKFDPKRPHLLATCSDDVVLKVLDTTKEFSIVYEDKRHADFVRGIEWYKEDLLSCAWDNSMFLHNIREAAANDK